MNLEQNWLVIQFFLYNFLVLDLMHNTLSALSLIYLTYKIQIMLNIKQNDKCEMSRT